MQFLRNPDPSSSAGAPWLPHFETVVVASSLLAMACNGDDGARRRGVDAVPVKIGTAVRKVMPVELKAVGTVEAYATVAVTAQTAGIITRVHFQEGQEVKEGDLLFDLDARPYRAALAEAGARLAGNRALLKKAEEDLRRYSSLVDKEYSTREQLDLVRANLEAIRATVAGGEAAVESARLSAEYCTVRAPIAGRTGSLLVYAGNVVSPNPAQPLVVILQNRPIRVAFAVSEKYLDAIRHRADAEPLEVAVRSSDSASPPSIGKLEFLDNAVDHASGTIRLKGVFENKDTALWPGQFVQVVLRLSEEKDALVVPSSAVQTGQQGPYVFVVTADETAELRPVVVDRIVGAETVLAKGVEGDEHVVTDGQLRLVPGGKVSLGSAKPPLGGAGHP